MPEINNKYWTISVQLTRTLGNNNVQNKGEYLLEHPVYLGTHVVRSNRKRPRAS